MRAFYSLIIGTVFGAGLVAGAMYINRPTSYSSQAIPEPDMLARFRVAIIEFESTCGDLMPFECEVGAGTIKCRCDRPAPLPMRRVP